MRDRREARALRPGPRHRHDGACPGGRAPGTAAQARAGPDGAAAARRSVCRRRASNRDRGTGATPAGVRRIDVHAGERSWAREAAAVPRARTAANDPSLLYRAALCHFYLNETRRLRVAGSACWRPRRQWVRVAHPLAARDADSPANHIPELRSALAQPRLRAVDEMLMSFSLAKELEDVSEFRNPSMCCCGPTASSASR